MFFMKEDNRKPIISEKNQHTLQGRHHWGEGGAGGTPPNNFVVAMSGIFR